MSNTLADAVAEDPKDTQRLSGLMAWHCGHLEDSDAYTDVLRPALQANVDKLEAQLAEAKQLLSEHLQERDKRQKWDGYNLLSFAQVMWATGAVKTKSLKLPGGYVVGSRAQKDLLKIVDPAPIMTALPECCELKLKDGDAKKELAVTDAGVIFARTGELVPEGSVEVSRPAGEKYYLKRPDGTELELSMLWQADVEEDETDADTGGADEPLNTESATDGAQ